jgi:hypothetical protein
VACDAEHQASMITVRLQRRDAGKERLECMVLLGSQGERESDHESIAQVGWVAQEPGGQPGTHRLFHGAIRNNDYYKQASDRFAQNIQQISGSTVKCRRATIFL